ETEAGLLLRQESLPELVLGDALGLDQDAAQAVLLVVLVEDRVELRLGQDLAVHQDLLERGIGQRLRLCLVGGSDLLLGDQPRLEKELPEQRAALRDRGPGRHPRLPIGLSLYRVRRPPRKFPLEDRASAR